MPYLVTVRYGRMGIVENFATDLADLASDERCVVQTERGEELGDCLTPATDLPPELPPELFPRLLRRAHVTDVFRLERFQAEDAVAALAKARTAATAAGQEVNLVDAEVLRGGEQVLLYYEGKFGGDFGVLVDHLARALHAQVVLSKASSRRKEPTVAAALAAAREEAGLPAGEG